MTIAWGPWEAANDIATTKRLGRRGLRALPSEDALDALSLALNEGAAHVVIADVDWPRFRPTLEVWNRRSLLAEIPGGKERSGQHSIRGELAKLPPSERPLYLRKWLQAQCAVVMGFSDPNEIDPQRDLFELGMESLMVAELRRRMLGGVGFISRSVRSSSTQPSMRSFSTCSAQAYRRCGGQGRKGFLPNSLRSCFGGLFDVVEKAHATA